MHLEEGSPYFTIATGAVDVHPHDHAVELVRHEAGDRAASSQESDACIQAAG